MASNDSNNVPWWRQNILAIGIGGGLGLIILVIILLVVIIVRLSGSSSGGSGAVAGPSQIAGRWKEVSSDIGFPSIGMYAGLPGIMQAAFQDPRAFDEMTIQGDGTYELQRVKTDSGTFTGGSLEPQGDNLNGQATLKSDRNGNSDSVSIMIVPASTMALNPYMPPGNQLLDLDAPAGGAGSTWGRNSSSNALSGQWLNPKDYLMDIPSATAPMVQHIYSSTLNFTDDGHYKVEFDLTLKGIFAIQGSNYTITVGTAMPETGTYSFDGKNTLTLISPYGKTVWQRE
jgi:hypothetical protein